MDFSPISNIIRKINAFWNLNVSIVTRPAISKSFCVLIKCALGARLLVIHVLTTFRCTTTLRHRFCTIATFVFTFTTFCFLKHFFVSHAFTRSTFRSTLVCLHFGSRFLHFFFLAVVVNVNSNLKGFLKRFTVIDTRKELTLIRFKRNHGGSTNLVVKIDTVDQTERIEICFLNFKEVFLIQFFITTSKRFTKPRILALHQLLDASILNDVDKVHRTVSNTPPVFVGGEESVTNFMTNQEVIDDVRCFVPVRQG